MYAVAIDGPAGAGKSTISRVAATKAGIFICRHRCVIPRSAYDILQKRGLIPMIPVQFANDWILLQWGLVTKTTINRSI